jgi:hypothetical protein
MTHLSYIFIKKNPIFLYNFSQKWVDTLHVYHHIHRVQRSIRGDCYVKRGVSVSKRLICEHGKFICICSNKGTESDRNQDIIMVYEAVIKVDINSVGLANTRAQL